MGFVRGRSVGSLFSSDGAKISSSVPRNRELSRASESSTRKSQAVLYVTPTEKGPAGESVIPKVFDNLVFTLEEWNREIVL
jgi:hypothetical protein